MNENVPEQPQNGETLTQGGERAMLENAYNEAMLNAPQDIFDLVSKLSGIGAEVTQRITASTDDELATMLTSTNRWDDEHAVLTFLATHEVYERLHR